MEFKEVLIKWWGVIIELIPIITIAMFGALARIVTKKDTHGRIQLSVVVAELFIASFLALVLHFILKEIGASENIRIIVASLSGYSAREVLTMLSNGFLKKISKDVHRIF